MPAEDWIELAHSDEPIACHTTIAVESGEGDWSDPKIRQCTGAAIYRRNNAKRVRNPEDASNFVEADRDTVFANRVEFLAHHDIGISVASTAKPARPVLVLDFPCGECNKREAEWLCRNCGDAYCDRCIDGAGKVCPTCLVDPGWEPVDSDEDDDFSYDLDEDFDL